MNTTLNQIRDESPCAVDGCDREIRLYAVWCARQVQHLMTDQRSIDALDVAERYANGLATENELDIARAAAWDAARDAEWDAEWDAARDAEWAVGAAQEVKFREMFCDIEKILEVQYGGKS